MSDFGKCPTCHEWNWMSNHVCPPRWYVTILDKYMDDEENIIHARDAQQAAERFALRFDMDGGDGYFLEGEIDVMVRLAGRPGASEEYIFTITGEMVPEYSAHEKEMPHE